MARAIGLRAAENSCRVCQLGLHYGGASAQEAVDMDAAMPLLRGVYDARRASALSGVPYSTLQYWARERVIVPSISPDRVRLWSWADLLKLRAITWLRKDRHVGMKRVLALLGDIDKVGLSAVPLQRIVLVSSRGEMFIRAEDFLYRADPGGQIGVEELLNLTGPFNGTGPDLLQPRPHLRIIPGKLSGQPHVVDTRIPSLSIYSLHRSGYVGEDIEYFYPDLSLPAIREAIDLETSLDNRAA